MARKPKPLRVLKKGADNSHNQELLELEWRKIGLTAPVREALVNAKLYKISDLRKISLEELAAMDGMSRSGVARIKHIMQAKRISFRPN